VKENKEKRPAGKKNQRSLILVNKFLTKKSLQKRKKKYVSKIAEAKSIFTSTLTAPLFIGSSPIKLTAVQTINQKIMTANKTLLLLFLLLK